MTTRIQAFQEKLRTWQSLEPSLMTTISQKPDTEDGDDVTYIRRIKVEPNGGYGVDGKSVIITRTYQDDINDPDTEDTVSSIVLSLEDLKGIMEYIASLEEEVGE